MNRKMITSTFLAALFSSLLAPSTSYSKSDSDNNATQRRRPRRAKLLVGAWQCKDNKTQAPFLATFFADGNLRVTLPDADFLPTHAIWKFDGLRTFEIEGRALVLSERKLAGVGTSIATGRLIGRNRLTASVSTFVELLDGTVVERPDFVLECEAIRL